MVSLAPKGQGPAIQKEVSLSSGQTAPTATRMVGQEAVPSPPRNSVTGKSSTYLTSCVHLILRVVSLLQAFIYILRDKNSDFSAYHRKLFTEGEQTF